MIAGGLIKYWDNDKEESDYLNTIKVHVQFCVYA